MTAKKHISGIHHITAVASSAAENLRFYETVLGLRLVKQTVNFDDPYTYHLYYGDRQGSPGTILTFFPWENLPPGRPGTGMVTAVNFAVPGPSIEFWIRRMDAHGIAVQTVERFGEPVIQLADPHGLPIELTATDAACTGACRDAGPTAKPYAVTGFHSATATLRSLAETKALLTDIMGMDLHGQAGNRYRFKGVGPRSPGQIFDLVVDPQAPPGRPGGGTVHHIAFRTEDDAAQADWQSLLRASGIAVTDVRDRKYFRSIYFHAPERVLYEIATDPPGFTVDESIDSLGASLMLPDHLEAMRADIEQRLPPLRAGVNRYVFRPPKIRVDEGQAPATFHGSGGNDLPDRRHSG